MASTHLHDALSATQQQTSSQQAGYVMQQQQQKAMQQSEARTAKRIKVEHGEEQSPAQSPVSSTAQQQAANGQARPGGSGTTPGPLALPAMRSAQQMGPPLNARPSTSATQSYNNGEVSSPVPISFSQSPSPQPTPGGSRGNVGPGRAPYQFGMGLPTPGINFTRTPTTGSFVANNSNSNSRQQTPTDTSRVASRASPSEGRAGLQGTSAQPGSSSAGASAPKRDGVDVLQDLLSISGVDLRAEEEAAQRNSMNRISYNTATAAASQASHHPYLRHTPFYLELYPLSRHIQRIAANHGLRVEPEVLTYLSLAAKTRFQNLLEAMIASSRHRTWSSHLRPPPLYERTGQAMYHEEIHDDPQKLMAALTRVAKREEQEARQARMLREEMEANNAQTGEGGENDGGVGGPGSSGQATPAERGKEGEEGKKKAKKPGSSATARNMSEDKRLKLANKTAAQALGISTNSKAWMFGGGAGSGGSGANSPFGSGKAGPGGSRLPKPRFTPVAAGSKGDEGGQDGEAGGTGGGDWAGTRSGSISVGGWGDLAARQRLKEEEEREARRRVNLQDALHALEMERSGGAGRGSGEEILYVCHALGRPPIRKL